MQAPNPPVNATRHGGPLQRAVAASVESYWVLCVDRCASPITGVLLLGGMQLIGLSVITKYLDQLTGEAKDRPVYILHEQPDSLDDAA